MKNRSHPENRFEKKDFTYKMIYCKYSDFIYDSLVKSQNSDGKEKSSSSRRANLEE